MDETILTMMGYWGKREGDHISAFQYLYISSEPFFSYISVLKYEIGIILEHLGTLTWERYQFLHFGTFT